MPVLNIHRPAMFKEQILDVLDYVNKGKSEDDRIGVDEWVRKEVRSWIQRSQIADIYSKYVTTGRVGNDSPVLDLSLKPEMMELDDGGIGPSQGYELAITFGDSQIRQLQKYAQMTNELNRWMFEREQERQLDEKRKALEREKRSAERSLLQSQISQLEKSSTPVSFRNPAQLVSSIIEDVMPQVLKDLVMEEWDEEDKMLKVKKEPKPAKKAAK